MSIEEIYAHALQLERNNAPSEERIQAYQTAIIAFENSGLISLNDQLNDVHTAVLKYITLDFDLAMAHASVGDMEKRRKHLQMTSKLLRKFLRRCDALELLHGDESRALEQLESTEDGDYTDISSGGSGGAGGLSVSSVMEDREWKLALFKRERSAQERIRVLRAVIARHQEEQGEGQQQGEVEVEVRGDVEEELRELYLLDIQTKCCRAFKEIKLAEEEMRLLAHMESLRSSSSSAGGGGEGARKTPLQPTQSQNQGLTITQVSSMDGQLLMREQVIKSVFEPRMSEPTMTLEEFADLEVKDALERERRQKESSSSGMATNAEEVEILRYKQLVEAGLEDDEVLAERATLKDRDWDAFKEANPRGSGNKMNKRY